MYINYILEVLLDLDLTLEYKKKLIKTVHVQALDLMYQFWDRKYCFFLMNFMVSFLMNIKRIIDLVFQQL